MFEILNQHSGLLSLLAVLAAVLVPFWIDRKQQKREKIREKKRTENECQDLIDELSSIKDMDSSPFPLSDEMRAKHAKINYLKRKLDRIKGER